MNRLSAGTKLLMKALAPARVLLSLAMFLAANTEPSRLE